MPDPVSHADVDAWVERYLSFMQTHGAFILAAQSAPIDDDVRERSARMQMRVAWLLGVGLRAKQRVKTQAPEALGVALQAMLERSWYMLRVQRLPIGDDDVRATISSIILSVIEN